MEDLLPYKISQYYIKNSIVASTSEIHTRTYLKVLRRTGFWSHDIH